MDQIVMKIGDQFFLDAPKGPHIIRLTDINNLAVTITATSIHNPQLQQTAQFPIGNSIAFAFSDDSSLHVLLKAIRGFKATLELTLNGCTIGRKNNTLTEVRGDEPAALLMVDFGPGFSTEEISACLSYLSETYRLQGGDGLKVVESKSAIPILTELPNVK